MEFTWILFAFVCGLAVKMINLPPLIGFLLAGFLLNYLGMQPSSILDSLASLGITLMLFSIGLKLHVKDLLKREVWASTLAHMGIWSILFAGIALLLGILSLPYFHILDFKTAALLGFALSFSSTVCVIKLLEESSELKTRHGQLSLGILVMQDIVAVIFLVVATGKIPSIWALGLFGLLLIRPLINKIVDKAGHGEMLPLTGLFLALGGYELFYLVGVKGDLGALIMGVLLASHPKASEMNKSLMNFKDLFLIGFFLSIGFTALPSLSMVAMSLIITLIILAKFALFFGVFTKLKLRSRTAFLSSAVLSNYSEFGLIVVALSVANGWLAKEWLVVLALAVSFSFVITSVLYRNVHRVYRKNKEIIRRFESADCLPEDRFTQPPNAEILVVGLGRVGRGAFDSLKGLVGGTVAGMDADRNRINQMQDAQENVFYGDGEDADLWERLDTSHIHLVLLALPAAEDTTNVAIQLRKANYTGQIAAIARYQDEREILINSGINNVFNFYTEAGTGFAEESLALIRPPENATA
ncbi:Glutathione-regulated potassium-efflux system protein KefC [Marinomonas spartinae]|uniref:Glutathione-regulated potassium-efflux system protein KefC n=1 Tax=Marinomonas spartinae TaxID=1792290 RepID=A0A1A8TS12_9GAMM|nr:cation:proton antiporter family protein [Marinomonas spartinae]SBS36062.1 Glutathione-regulated potassium-efflux system protein KefC [Marinomonas spartinae]